MRRFNPAWLFILFAAPAYGQPAPHQQDPALQGLPSPEEAHRMADAAGRAAEALLDVPVGGLVRAIDPDAPVRRDDTIESLSGDARMRDRVRSSADRFGAGMEALLAQLAVATPELRRTVDELEDRFGRVIDEIDAREPDDLDDPYR